ncbi:MAG: hypothetical protein KBC64_03295 [Simkaniaceae bacterium]|nr:hypothetical protein [Simkaniaceae bacterium]
MAPVTSSTVDFPSIPLPDELTHRPPTFLASSAANIQGNPWEARDLDLRRMKIERQHLHFHEGTHRVVTEALEKLKSLKETGTPIDAIQFRTLLADFGKQRAELAIPYQIRERRYMIIDGEKYFTEDPIHNPFGELRTQAAITCIKEYSPEYAKKTIEFVQRQFQTDGLCDKITGTYNRAAYLDFLFELKEKKGLPAHILSALQTVSTMNEAAEENKAKRNASDYQYLLSSSMACTHWELLKNDFYHNLPWHEITKFLIAHTFYILRKTEVFLDQETTSTPIPVAIYIRSLQIGSDSLKTTRYFCEPQAITGKSNELMFKEDETSIYIEHMHPSLIEDCLVDLGMLFTKIMQWSPEEDPSATTLKTLMAKFLFIYGEAMPFSRGSAAIGEWLEMVMYGFHNFHIKYNPGTHSNLAVFCHSLEEYIKAYPTFFELEPMTSPEGGSGGGGAGDV